MLCDGGGRGFTQSLRPPMASRRRRAAFSGAPGPLPHGLASYKAPIMTFRYHMPGRDLLEGA
jgi:hypothetical protein